MPLTAEITLRTKGTVYEFPAKKKLSLKNGKLTLNFKPVEGKLLIVYPDAVSSVKVEKAVKNNKPVLSIRVLDSKQKKLKGIQPIRITLVPAGGKKVEYFSSAKDGELTFTNLPSGEWKVEVEELASGTKTVREWTE